jgi:hypothetical protein
MPPEPLRRETAVFKRLEGFGGTNYYIGCDRARALSNTVLQYTKSSDVSQDRLRPHYSIRLRKKFSVARS